MGKIQILTKEQQIILDEVNKNPFLQQFYFTGGTALSAFYLNHRYSEDLDFFTEKEFDTQDVLAFIDSLSKQYSFTFTSEFHQVVYTFLLKFYNVPVLKIDFARYPYKRIKEWSVINGIKTDSLTDIAVNKLLTITQRNTVKDFVDLFFLLQKFSVWDLIQGVRLKFKMELEPYVLSSELLKAEDFDFLPKMVKPLTLNELKTFFRKEAKEIGRKAVE